MTPKPQHGTPAGDATLAIQKLARQTGGDVQDLLTLYALEALLARIAHSRHRGDFILKGGVLLAAFSSRRPTKDIDLQATGFSNDASDVTERIRAIASIELSDGVVWYPDSVTSTVIRDNDEYAGVRVRLSGQIGTARITVGIDVNFGDPVWPAPQPVELPPLVSLGQPPLVLLGYPLTMVLAEKIVTAVDRAEANTRWRDFADIYGLTRLHPVRADELRESVTTVADYRKVTLVPLLPRLADMPLWAQPRWQAWRVRVNRDRALPEQFAHVLDSVAAFADPVLEGAVLRGTWDPGSGRWIVEP